jgi:hypothetical protein
LLLLRLCDGVNSDDDDDDDEEEEGGEERFVSGVEREWERCCS